MEGLIKVTIYNFESSSQQEHINWYWDYIKIIIIYICDWSEVCNNAFGFRQSINQILEKEWMFF